MAKVLHIKVRHQSEPHRDWLDNQWLDDDRILSIVTYPELADLCEPLIATGAPVRIHRCGYKHPDVICCEAAVKAVRRLDEKRPQVEFTNVRSLHPPPPIPPNSRKAHYFAEVSEVAPGEFGDSVSTTDAARNQTAHLQAEPSNLPKGDPGPSTPKAAPPSSPPSAEPWPRQQSKHLEILSRGPEEWNHARKNIPKPDFAGADLREALRKVGSDKSVQLDAADMRRAVLAGLEFDDPILVDASLVGADLTGAKWQDARGPGPERLWDKANRLNLREANLTGANLSRTTFRRPYLHGASFRSAKLVGADLSGSNLTDICFDGADLRCANLRKADLTGASLVDADLRGTDLSSAIVTEHQVAQAVTDSDTRRTVR
jgi:uncharacterized protein YjbI with pentapeptide repeats